MHSLESMNSLLMKLQHPAEMVSKKLNLIIFELIIGAPIECVALLKQALEFVIDAK